MRTAAPVAVLVAVLAAFLAAECTPPVSLLAAEGVFEATPEQVADCEFRGSVEGRDQGSLGASFRDAELRGRANAGERGANRVVWYGYSRGRADVSLVGRAYRCPEATSGGTSP